MSEERAEMERLLVGALIALGRQGWEDGPTDGEVQSRIWDFLDADNRFSRHDDGGTAELKRIWERR